MSVSSTANTRLGTTRAFPTITEMPQHVIKRGKDKGTDLILLVNSIKLETGLRPNSAGIPYTLLLRIEAIGFPTFRLLL